MFEQGAFFFFLLLRITLLYLSKANEYFVFVQWLWSKIRLSHPSEPTEFPSVFTSWDHMLDIRTSSLHLSHLQQNKQRRHRVSPQYFDRPIDWAIRNLPSLLRSFLLFQQSKEKNQRIIHQRADMIPEIKLNNMIAIDSSWYWLKIVTFCWVSRIWFILATTSFCNITFFAFLGK